MTGIVQALQFPFWLCFGWGNKSIVGSHKRVDEEEGPPEQPALLQQRLQAAEAIASLSRQLDEAREVIAHEEQRSADLYDRAKKLMAAGRESEARQAMNSRLIAIESARKMGARVNAFERTVSTLKLNAVDAQFTTMLRAAVDAARAQTSGAETQEIIKLKQELDESMKNADRTKGVMEAGLAKDDVFIDETGEAVSMQEKLDEEMRALRASIPAAAPPPASVSERTAPAPMPVSAYKPGIAPVAPAPAPTSARQKNPIRIAT